MMDYQKAIRKLFQKTLTERILSLQGEILTTVASGFGEPIAKIQAAQVWTKALQSTLEQEIHVNRPNSDGFQCIQDLSRQVKLPKSYQVDLFYHIRYKLENPGAPKAFGVCLYQQGALLLDPRNADSITTTQYYAGDSTAIFARYQKLPGQENHGELTPLTSDDMIAWLKSELPVQSYRDSRNEIQFVLKHLIATNASDTEHREADRLFGIANRRLNQIYQWIPGAKEGTSAELFR